MDDLAGMAPPHDIENEAAVLSAVMTSEDARANVADFLRPEHFYSGRHDLIFEACMGLFAAASPVDTVTVAAWLSDRGRLAQVGGVPYLMEVQQAAPIVANARRYAERVHSLWRLRQAQNAARRTVAEASVSGADAQGFLDDCARVFHELAHAPGSAAELVHIAGPMRETYEEAEQAAKAGVAIRGLETGVDRLDRLTGGLRDGGLTVLAARPGKGKSSLALQIALNASAHGHPVAFFSLEMPKYELAVRAACAEGRIDVVRQRCGMLSPVEWRRYSEVTAHVSGWPLYLDETAGVTAMAIRSRLRHLNATLARDSRRVRLVVVDYLQLMHASPGQRGRSREQEVSECSKSLKEIAKEFSVPVLAICQMNRAIEQAQRRPRLSDLRESGAIEQDADNVLFIHETKDRSVVELVLEKQRNGPAGIVRARFDRQYTRFDNLAEGEFDDDEAAQ